jgi:hypothetical protein
MPTKDSREGGVSTVESALCFLLKVSPGPPEETYFKFVCGYPGAIAITSRPVTTSRDPGPAATTMFKQQCRMVELRQALKRHGSPWRAT